MSYNNEFSIEIFYFNFQLRESSQKILHPFASGSNLEATFDNFSLIGLFSE